MSSVNKVKMITHITLIKGELDELTAEDVHKVLITALEIDKDLYQAVLLSIKNHRPDLIYELDTK